MVTTPSKLKATKQPAPAGAAPVAGGFVPTRFCLEMSEPGSRERLLSTEWLLTNGLGGFAMGTASGAATRRYHAQLIGATMPPVGRVSALSATVDTLVIGDGADAKRIDLSTFVFAGGGGGGGQVVHPDGLSRLVRFEKDLTCRWVYRVQESGVEVEIVRELVLLDHVNAAQVRFKVTRLSGTAAMRLEIRPLLALRDMHAIIRRDWADAFEVTDVLGGVRVRHPQSPTPVYLTSAGASVARDVQWWNQFFYAIDAERQQECVEDLFTPAVMTLQIGREKQAGCVLQAALEPIAIEDADASIRRRHARLSAAYAHAMKSRPGDAPTSDTPVIAALVSAADDFVVKKTAPDGRGDSQTSIIAGYPWFADWGRDTSISMLGLLIATGRLEEAGRTLSAFASHRRNGIVPNVFNDQTGRPEYNTVDASLWFILGCCAYFKASTDRTLWDGQLLPACLDIVSCYRKGTDFNIAMDPQDKLVTAGTSATQLTWMDAKRDGVAFTPRHGKPVEVNALWFAALKELSLATRGTDGAISANLGDLAEATGKSFRAKFWNAEAGCLFDVLTPSGEGAGWKAMPEIRPNQLFAVSLPHSPLSPEQQRGVLSVMREKLLTPYGVRTLAPASTGYQSRYEGDMWSRDRAYHNGTAWPWLLGAYAEGVLRVGAFSAAARREAHGVLEPIIRELMGQSTRTAQRGCIGQIAEVYDAEPPQRPQGCTAQAWSVAEVLRVMLMV